MRLGRISFQILRGIGITVLFLVVLELCARTDDWIKWDAPFLSNYSNENLRVADSLGFHNRPNARFEKWNINSHGFRGPEITMEKPDGVIRVVVVGASETFGLFESESMDFPSQMQTMLDSASPGQYQVINGACAGMSPPRIRDYYRNWISKFDPDIIVYYPSPGFYLDIEPPRAEYNAGALAHWKPSRMPRLFDKVKRVLKQFIPQQFQSYYKEYKREKYVSRHPEGWVFESAPPDRLTIFREHLTDLVNKVRNDSVGMIIATHAHRLGDSLTEVDQYHVANLRADWPRVSLQSYIRMEEEGNKVILNVANSTGIPAVNIASAVPKSDVYFFDIGHFRNEGATIVARELVAEILRFVPDETRVSR